MNKLTDEQIEAIIDKINTEHTGIISFGSCGSYESMDYAEIIRRLKEIGDK
jgi:hypothetical protein